MQRNCFGRHSLDRMTAGFTPQIWQSVSLTSSEVIRASIKDALTELHLSELVACLSPQLTVLEVSSPGMPSTVRMSACILVSYYNEQMAH